MPGAPVIKCHGNGPDHCCYLGDQICPWLQEFTMPGRRWVCGLLVEYGTWETMNASPEYQPIGTYWARNGTRPHNYCQTFDPAFCCRPEFRMGRANEHSEPRLDLIGAPHGDLG